MSAKSALLYGIRFLSKRESWIESESSEIGWGRESESDSPNKRLVYSLCFTGIYKSAPNVTNELRVTLFSVWPSTKKRAFQPMSMSTHTIPIGDVVRGLSLLWYLFSIGACSFMHARLSILIPTLSSGRTHWWAGEGIWWEGERERERETKGMHP